MFHPLQPAFGAEPVGEEYIELFNRGVNPVNLDGCRFDKGISFTFSNVTLPAGNYLAVAANRSVFASKYPGVTNVVGDWAGTLGNNGEQIRLVDAGGNTLASVSYGTEGDWATRQRSLADAGTRGWIWNCPADGLGRSMELRNPFLGNNNGQNWAPSGASGGTPGRVNSAFTNNVAPLLLDLAHSPLVPKSTEAVTVTARIVDESVTGLAVALRWRVDANPQTNPFNTEAMFDDGGHGDGVAGDGLYGGVLPAQPNNTVVEFYVQAVDAGGRTNTWPRPAIAAADSAGPTGQVVNALFQVDDNSQNGFGVVSSSQPVYKLIMTEAERALLASIPGISSLQGPNSEMNGTFISLDGTGVELRHRCGFRNRGHGSRTRYPPNYRVNVPNDQRWKDRRAINFNSDKSSAQVLAAIIAQKAGLAGANAYAAQVRVNNANLATTSTSMLGAYAALEEPNSDWAETHFPLDSAGNIYRAIRDTAPDDFIWRGPSAAAYTNTYFKGDNSSAYDWSDIIQLHRIVGTNDLFTIDAVREVANVEQWCVYFAVMTLFGNNETSPNIGYNDDYYMYRGVNDPRFILMYYDNDTVLSDSLYGAISPANGIFGAEANNGMGAMTTRFLESPDIKPIYYATMQRLLSTTFSASEYSSIVDEALTVYPPGSSVNSVANGVKTYMNARRTTVQNLINGQVPPAPSPPATISGEPRSPTPFTSATLTVGGSGISHYRFSLNDGPFGPETPVSTIINLSGLANGSTNWVVVIGRTATGSYQTYGTASKPWVVRTSMLPVRLNEVLARNDSAVNHAGTYPDAVELFNEGATLLDLSGLRLTDDPADPSKFTFPTGTTLGAGNYLVVYANNDDGTPGIHLGFALNQDGDGLYLYDRSASGGALLDTAVFGLQVADSSIGRLGNGGTWILCQPSFGTNNAAQPLGDTAGLHINEWLASGTLPFVDDFIEIHNPDPLPVALSGLYLTDQPIGAPALHQIADTSFIAGGGFSVFLADGNAGTGANHLGFQLSSELGQIGLNRPDLSPIDSISYPPQVTGVAQGRCGDGSTKIVFLSFPTPGSPNACPAAPPALRLVNLIPLANAWKYNQNAVDLGTVWREVGYDDSSWPAGGALLGKLRSGGSVPEPIPTALTVGSGRTTYYFRTHFTLNPGSNFTSLQISNVVDDGAVFYLNGSEIGRFNMPTGAVTFGTLASGNLSDAAWTGPISVPTNVLQSGDNVFAVEVHQATSSSADVMFGLRLDGVIGGVSPQGAGVILTEALANNATIVETDGATPDWVEIFNPSANPVDLGNMSLSDSTLNPRRWVFPSPSLLPPQGYWVVRCDGTVPASAANTGFGLKATGDSLYLFNADLTVRDWITFGLQAADFSIGRVPIGSSNWVLTLPSPGVSNTAALLGDALHLKVNEWMAAPSSGDDWFELFNPDAQPVSLGGLGLSDDLVSSSSRLKTRIPALSFIGSLTNGYQQFRADKNIAAGADHVDFKLDGTAGDEIGVSTTNGTLIDGVHFGPQQVGVSEGRLPDGGTNIARFPATASPGDGNYLVLTDVVIDEVLAHTDLPLEDAIELQNLSGAPANIGGWYLSDSKDNFRKYLIPGGTTLGAGGFKVFYEYQFNSPDYPATAFALSSSKGDQVYLSQATNGQLTGYRAEVKFGASANGVSFGRHLTSAGADFTAMSALSFGTAVTAQSPTNQITLFRTGQGATNPYPWVGPVIINQIMYHPPDVVEAGVTNDNVVEEFVELRNISAQTVPLYDPAHPANGWRLRDAVDFRFSASHALPPGGFLQVVSFDPVTNLVALARFRARYGTNSILLGPYSGKLDNGGESVELTRPDAPEVDGFVPFILVEKVVYGDSAPWPTNADGHGAGLLRVSPTGYGNEPTNWIGSLPTLGSPGISDSDRDGMPDDWETQNGFNKNNPSDAAQDADGDGMTNLEEYLSGTNPRSALSYLKVEGPAMIGGEVVVKFLAAEGKTYTIQYRDLAEGGDWQRLADVGASSLTQVVTVPDPAASSASRRFYRLVTPAQP
jgi:hypothetical protein